MKRSISTLFIAAAICSATAQDSNQNEVADDILDLKVELRADYQHEWLDGHTIDDNSGFKGKYLNIAMNGNISDHFSYSLRHRLNKTSFDSNFFDATDWAWVAYSVKNWEISAGKQVVAIGGFEYDRAPIDLYFCSEFWNNVACYQFGVSGGYAFKNGKDKLTFQVCQSPFRNHTSAWNPNARNLNMFAYNLIWYGNHGPFSAIYSVNMLEYAPGRFINYISLGNKFTHDKVSLEFDFMNRATAHQTFLFDDFSLVGEIAWKPNKRFNIFGKVSYDVNNSSNNDLYILPGTKLTRVGGGIEYFPFINNKHTIRLHANFCYTFGDNGNIASTLSDKNSYLDLGFTWKFDIIKLKRK